jgi:hypothetical protein
MAGQKKNSNSSVLKIRFQSKNNLEKKLRRSEFEATTTFSYTLPASRIALRQLHTVFNSN